MYWFHCQKSISSTLDFPLIWFFSEKLVLEWCFEEWRVSIMKKINSMWPGDDMVSQIRVIIDSGNGLLPDGTEREPMLTNRQWGLFTWYLQRKFHTAVKHEKKKPSAVPLQIVISLHAGHSPMLPTGLLLLLLGWCGWPSAADSLTCYTITRLDSKEGLWPWGGGY